MEKLEVKYIPAGGNDKKPTFLPSTLGKGNKACSGRTVLIVSAVAVAVSLALFCLFFIWVLEEPREEQQRILDNIREEEEVLLSKFKSDSPCLKPKMVGMCRAAMPRWYYDAAKGQCSQFIYGGCDGNENNFESLNECLEICEKQSAGRNINIANNNNNNEEDEEQCQLSPTAGPCRGLLPRYYYDPEDDSCKSFNYGGCGGNTNNFMSMFDCENKCKVNKEDSVIKKSRVEVEEKEDTASCDLKAETGMCRAAIERWFHKDGHCKTFIWGGCGGNDNNFATKEKCEDKCLLGKAKTESVGDALCSLSAAVGPCRAAMPRYYFDKATNQCQSFIYGGCDGNPNNFEDIETCESRCKI